MLSEVSTNHKFRFKTTMAYVVAVCHSPKAGCLGKVTAEKI